jgi:hypothetical protein
MTRQKNDTQESTQSQVSFEARVQEQLQQAVRTALVSVLEAEVDAFITQVASIEITTKKHPPSVSVF